MCTETVMSKDGGSVLRCTLPDGHANMHMNETRGVAWVGDEEGRRFVQSYAKDPAPFHAAARQITEATKP